MKRKIFSILFAVVLVLSFSLVMAAPAQAATINVPGDHTTIQAAIDAANPYDTIIVAAGDYNEVVNIYKSNLVVKSASGAEVTTIVATSAVATVDFIGASPEFGLVENSVLDGFTVINEFMGGPFPVVVRFQHASGCVAKNNVIIGPSTDTVPHMSGVVMSGEHNATINNILENSTISNCWNGFVVFGPGADGNTIRNNIVEENSNGAWIEYETKNTVVQGNDIINNILLGIGIDEQYWNPSVNILINYNNIYGNGFGIKADYQVLTTPVNATHNWWDDTSGPGGVGPGTGDAVSAYVDYSSWLGAPVVVPSLCCQTLGPGAGQVVDAIAEADTKATVDISPITSETDIYIVKYESQPFPEEPFPDASLGKFIDIYLSNPAAVVWPIYVEVHYTDGEVRAAGIGEGSLGLYYYMSPDTFHRCSDTGVDTTNNIIWAYMTEGEAVGSPVGGGGRPPVVGGTVLPVDKVSILMPWIGMAVALALAGVFIARFARRKVRS